MRERSLRELRPNSVDRASAKRPSAGREVSGIHKKVEVSQLEQRRAMFDVFKKHRKFFDAANMLVAAGSFSMAVGVHSDPDLASAYAGYLATSFLDRSPASVEDARRLYRLTSRVDGVFDDIVRHSERRREAELGEPRSTSIEGFDSVGIPSALIEKAIDQGFPRGWSDGRRVPRIVYDSAAKRSLSYPGLEGARAAAWCTSLDAGQSQITLSGVQFSEEKFLPTQVHQFFTDILIHEFAHAHDWDDNARLTPSEALRLHEIVIERSLAPGRPLFAYPEDIHASVPDEERRARAAHAAEYFAELVGTSLRPHRQVDGTSPLNWLSWEAAFSDALIQIYNASDEEAEKNAHLMRWFFTKNDPKFQPWVASVQLERIAHQAVMDVASAHFSDIVAPLPRELADVLIDEMQSKEHAHQDQYADVVEAQSASYAIVQREIGYAVGMEGLRAFPFWASLVGSIRTMDRMRNPSEGGALPFWRNIKINIERFTAAQSSLSQAQRADLERLCQMYAKGVIHEDFHYVGHATHR